MEVLSRPVRRRRAFAKGHPPAFGPRPRAGTLLNWPHLARGLAFEARRLRRLGGGHVLRKLISRLASVAAGLLLLPLTVILHAAGFRRIMVFTDRIGHLALEPDCLLRDQALGRIPARRWFLLALPGRVANEHLLRYWERTVPVVRAPLACFVLESMTRFGLMRHDLSRYLLSVRGPQAAYRVYAEWGDRPPLLALTDEDRHWGDAALRRLGIPPGAWFVCIHAREGGFSPADEELHAHRNSDILATIPAIEEIVRRGGWVVRIGDATMKPLPPMPRVVDYAHHEAKSDRLDVVLCASARFILGNTSGIALVGTVFGVPCAVANMIPTPTLWFNRSDLGIPKLLWSKALGRYLRLDEIMRGDVADFRYAALYEEAGLRPDENSPEDIEELAREMLDRLEGRFEATAEDEQRARQAKSLFTNRHYAMGSCAGFGSRFLRRHGRLLGLAPGDGTVQPETDRQ